MKESRLKSINGFGSKRVLADDEIEIAIELAHTSKESWKYRDFLSVLAKRDEHLLKIVQAQCVKLGTVPPTVFEQIRKLGITHPDFYLKLIASLAPLLLKNQFDDLPALATLSKDEFEESKAETVWAVDEPGPQMQVAQLTRDKQIRSDNGKAALLSFNGLAEHLQPDELATEFLKRIKIVIDKNGYLTTGLNLNFVKSLSNKDRANFVSGFLSVLSLSENISQDVNEKVIFLLSKIVKFLSPKDRIKIFNKLLRLSLKHDICEGLSENVMYSFDNFAKDLSDEECKEVLPKLLSFANCADNHARSAAVYCFGGFIKRFSGQELKCVLDALEKLAEDVDTIVRIEVGICLNNTNFTELQEEDYEQVFVMLLSLTQDKKFDVRSQAEIALVGAFVGAFVDFPDHFSRRKLDLACEKLLVLVADAVNAYGRVFMLDDVLWRFAKDCSDEMRSTVVTTLLEVIKKESGKVLKAATKCFRGLVSALQETQLLEVGQVLLTKLEQESDQDIKNEMLFVLSDICLRLLPTSTVDMAEKVLAIARENNAFELEAKIRLCLFDAARRSNLPSPTNSPFEALFNATWDASFPPPAHGSTASDSAKTSAAGILFFKASSSSSATPSSLTRNPRKRIISRARVEDYSSKQKKQRPDDAKGKEIAVETKSAAETGFGR